MKKSNLNDTDSKTDSKDTVFESSNGNHSISKTSVLKEPVLNGALQFLENIDALKNTYRQCLIMNGDREESTAEHSFSLAMAVLSFATLSDVKIDVIKTLKMALFHDLAEALLGDTFHYNKPNSFKDKSESVALKKLLTPLSDEELKSEIYQLWEEFEYSGSAEAQFLRGVDRFLPMYHNYKTQGHSWKKHGITRKQALEKNVHIQKSSAALWEYTQNMLKDSQDKGWIL